MAASVKGKPSTTATLKSVEITWKGKDGKTKTMKVDLSKAGGIWWKKADDIPWDGVRKEKFPGTKLAVAESAPVKTLLSMPQAPEDLVPEDQALCWWDEVNNQWVCPLEPDQ